MLPIGSSPCSSVSSGFLGCLPASLTQAEDDLFTAGHTGQDSKRTRMSHQLPVIMGDKGTDVCTSPVPVCCHRQGLGKSGMENF